MNIDIETVDGVTVVKLTGELDSVVSPVVQQPLLPIAKSGGKLVLDMTGVSFVSSAGLRMLLSIYRHVSSSGGRVVLVGVANEIQEILDITGFSHYLPLYKTLAEGMEALVSRRNASS